MPRGPIIATHETRCTCAESSVNNPFNPLSLRGKVHFARRVPESRHFPSRRSSVCGRATARLQRQASFSSREQSAIEKFGRIGSSSIYDLHESGIVRVWKIWNCCTHDSYFSCTEKRDNPRERTAANFYRLPLAIPRRRSALHGRESESSRYLRVDISSLPISSTIIRSYAEFPADPTAIDARSRLRSCQRTRVSPRRRSRRP